MRKSTLIQHLCAIPGDPHILVPVDNVGRMYGGLHEVIHEPHTRRPEHPGFILLKRTYPVRTPRREIMKTTPTLKKKSVFNAHAARRTTHFAKKRQEQEDIQMKARLQAEWVERMHDPTLEDILDKIEASANKGESVYVHVGEHMYTRPLFELVAEDLQDLDYKTEIEEGEYHGAWQLRVTW